MRRIAASHTGYTTRQKSQDSWPVQVLACWIRCDEKPNLKPILDDEDCNQQQQILNHLMYFQITS
jgi:hypothetical protein